MMDDRMGERLEQAAREYHRPPGTPREEMWAAIQAERARRRARPRVLVARPWMRWSLAAAAILVAGIAIGRATRPRPQGVPTASVAPVAPADLPYRVAAAQYLTRTEALLVGFRVGVADSQFTTQARDLLLTTRLMLNSPVAESPRMKALLEDLELLLAQIAVLPRARDRSSEDVQLINEGIEQRSVLLRLRTSVPPTSRGAL